MTLEGVEGHFSPSDLQKVPKVTQDQPLRSPSGLRAEHGHRHGDSDEGSDEGNDEDDGVDDDGAIASTIHAPTAPKTLLEERKDRPTRWKPSARYIEAIKALK